MTNSLVEKSKDYLSQSQQVLKAAADSDEFLECISNITETLVRTLRAGGKILLAGNGGSAGDAQHIAGEFLSRLNFDRAPLAAIALTVDTSVLTAIGNDYGFDQVFERQVRGLGRQGDVLIAISTSGQSTNILNALGAARELGLTTVGFTGAKPSPLRQMCDLTLAAPSTSTPLIQQVHLTAAHIICGLVESKIFVDAA
jgi:D-sedoheptulose 7-phosphate isomerase